jgi:L-fuconolactonase
MPAVNRRQFVASSLALAAAAALADEKPALPIIDTHQHLWDLKQFKLPWVMKGSTLDRDYVMSDYLEATKGLNVVKTVYMEVDVDPSQQQAEADFVTEVCKSGKTPMVAAVVSGRPSSEGFAKYVTPFKGSPYIKGLRQVLHGGSTPAGYCLDERFVKGIRLLGELGLSFDLCMRPGELPDAAKLIDACPDTRFILDHCGNANVQAKDRTQWKKDIAEVAKRKSVVCKVSGIVASAAPGKWKADDLAPIVEHTLEVFGPDRVMFGGDWPVCTLAATFAQWVTALKEIVRGRKEEEQRKLFHDNAVRVYALKG